MEGKASLSWVERLRRCRELCKLRRDVPESWREYLDERAAIREFHGDQSRDEAERGAWDDLRWLLGAGRPKPHPQPDGQTCLPLDEETP